MTAPADGLLVLGPLLRYVDETSASIWCEVARHSTVTVHAGDQSWSARTFGVHGHHYALVECEGLEPGTVTAYCVDVEGDRAWPPPTTSPDLPAPAIRTSAPGKPLRMAFGSCRTSVPHDEAGNAGHGVDALRAYALAHAGVTRRPDRLDWPDLVLFLGDQVYADETTEEMQQFISARRDIAEPPWTELRDFEEYAHLYRLAWSDPVNRWLLSSVPSAMIFDDHDVRDDWNTSYEWRQQMRSTDWWQGRIVAALASYWVYQHLGNLSPRERAADEIWQHVVHHDGPDEVDLTDLLDSFAQRADQEPSRYRWSFTRDFTDTRLVVVDTRAARVLTQDERSMVHEQELDWFEHQLRSEAEHLLVGTSLPFLLPPGLHHLEAFSEALAGGAWGRTAARVGERLRVAADLEHWAAFQSSFQQVAAIVQRVARGKYGRPPRTVTFLSGDVHHSYLSEVLDQQGATRIRQAVCSPIRNPLPKRARWLTAVLSYGFAGPVGLVAARSAKVADPPFRWRRTAGPWFDNTLATLEVTDRGLLVRWMTGVVGDGVHDRPQLEPVARILLAGTTEPAGGLRSAHARDATMNRMQGSVTVQMNASPKQVWDLVSDVTRIGEFSPETFEAEWVDGATGPALGAKFRGHVKRNGVGPVYWTSCKVTSCVPERDFGFAVYAAGGRANNWRYELRPKDGGTEVTESFRLEPHGWAKVYWALLGWARGRTNERGMRQTLERIKAVVEARPA